MNSLEIYPAHLLKIRWLRENRILLSKRQWLFVESISMNRRLGESEEKFLDEIYFNIKEIKILEESEIHKKVYLIEGSR